MFHMASGAHSMCLRTPIMAPRPAARGWQDRPAPCRTDCAPALKTWKARWFPRSEPLRSCTPRVDGPGARGSLGPRIHPKERPRGVWMRVIPQVGRLARRWRTLAAAAGAAALVAGAMPLGPVALASSATLYVSPTGSDTGACSQAAPCATIGHAVAVAAAGDTIVVESGTYDGQVVTP